MQERLDQKLYVARLKAGQLIESLLAARDPQACLKEWAVPEDLKVYGELLEVLTPSTGTVERAMENIGFLTDLANHESARSLLGLGPTLPALGVSARTGGFELVLSGRLRYRGEGSYYGVGLEEFYFKGFITRRKISTVARDIFGQDFVASTWADIERMPKARWNHSHLLVQKLSRHDPKSLLLKVRKNL